MSWIRLATARLGNGQILKAIQFTMDKLWVMLEQFCQESEQLNKWSLDRNMDRMDLVRGDTLGIIGLDIVSLTCL